MAGKVWTPEKIEQAKAKRAATLAAKKAEKNAPVEYDQHAKVAAVDGVEPSTLSKLLAEIEGLKQQLESEKLAHSQTQADALERAKAQGTLMQPGIEEVPTGKTVKVRRCLGKYETVGYKDDGRPILKAKFDTIELPTFFYKIDLPPCGGTDMKINGVPLYHGTTMEFDIDTLRTVKDMVFRQWKHDADIHGSDENFYRKPKGERLSMRHG